MAGNKENAACFSDGFSSFPCPFLKLSNMDALVTPSVSLIRLEQQLKNQELTKEDLPFLVQLVEEKDKLIKALRRALADSQANAARYQSLRRGVNSPAVAAVSGRRARKVTEKLTETDQETARTPRVENHMDLLHGVDSPSYVNQLVLQCEQLHIQLLGLNKKFLQTDFELRSKMDEIEKLTAILGNVDKENAALKLEVEFLRASALGKKPEQGLDRNESLSVEAKIEEQVQNLIRVNEDLMRKYELEMNLRKQLHSKIVDLKGQIRVFCRVRPVCGQCCVTSYDQVDKSVIVVKNKEKSLNFTFDRVFDEAASNEQVFDELKDMVLSCIDGFNVCFMAYGQTGAGKTYTIEFLPTGISVFSHGGNRNLENATTELKKAFHRVQCYITCLIILIYNKNVKVKQGLPHLYVFMHVCDLLLCRPVL